MFGAAWCKWCLQCQTRLAKLTVSESRTSASTPRGISLPSASASVSSKQVTLYASPPSSGTCSIVLTGLAARRPPIHEQLVQEDRACAPLLCVLLRLASFRSRRRPHWCVFLGFKFPPCRALTDVATAGVITDTMQNRGNLPAWKWLFLSASLKHQTGLAHTMVHNTDLTQLRAA